MLQSEWCISYLLYDVSGVRPQPKHLFHVGGDDAVEDGGVIQIYGFHWMSPGKSLSLPLSLPPLFGMREWSVFKSLTWVCNVQLIYTDVTYLFSYLILAYNVRTLPSHPIPLIWNRDRLFSILHAGHRGVKWARWGWTSFHLHEFCPHPLLDNDRTKPTALPSEGESDTRLASARYIEDTLRYIARYIARCFAGKSFTFISFESINSLADWLGFGFRHRWGQPRRQTCMYFHCLFNHVNDVLVL